IADELIPHIDNVYATIPGDRTYYGHSLGAAFGLSTLFTQPGLFNRYILSSASVHHRDSNDFLLREARELIAPPEPPAVARVYLSVGTEEEFEPALQPWELTSSFFRLAAF